MTYGQQVGSTIIALNGPQETSASTIKEFQHLFLSLGFIIYGSAVILSALIIIFFIAPKYARTFRLTSCLTKHLELLDMAKNRCFGISSSAVCLVDSV